MLDGVSPLLRKLLALTILVFGAYAVWTGIARPVMSDLETYTQDTKRDRVFLSRYLGHAAAKPALEETLAELGKSSSAPRGYLKTQNPALAAAVIQDRLKRIIARSRGVLKSAQVLAPKDEGIARKIAVDAMIEADINHLKNILYDIETNTPYLFVDEFQIRKHVARGSRARPRTGVSRLQTPTGGLLQVRLRVSGFIQGGEP